MAGLASARSMRRRANCGFRGVASAKYGPARSRGFGRTNCAAQRMSTSDSGDTRMHAGSTLCGWSARCVKNKAFRSLTIHEILVVAFRPESRPPHLQVCETARRKADTMIRYLLPALLLSAAPAFAAPPPGTDPNSEISHWYQSLKIPGTDISCCSQDSDCRPHEYRIAADYYQIL